MKSERKNTHRNIDPRYRIVIASLINLREEAGLSQALLAEKIGLSQPDISKIERYERRIDILELHDWIMATKNSPTNIISKITASWN